MRRLMILVALLLLLPLLVGTAGAKHQLATPSHDRDPGRYPNTLFWYDDIEGDTSGWTTVDNSGAGTPHFHVDTYYAYDTNSWWCGELNAEFSGGDGYGSSWDDRLGIPPTDVSGSTYPILTLKARYDSELGYDFTHVQAESGRVWIDLNTGYDGSSGGWFDIGVYGFPLGAYNNPVVARFRFVSDGGWDDSDGLYASDGGAFHCDDIEIFDFYTSTTYFFDDVESGGLCVPSVPTVQWGDWWHVVTDNCSSYSPPHSWWCGDDADTGLIPPNLNNSLITPPADVSGAITCTLRYALHAEVPQLDNDYWHNAVRFNGGDWISLGSWWGDFGGCDAWGTSGLDGEDITEYLPDTRLIEVQYKLTFFTTDNGCGPGVAGGAGINLDDTWFEGVHESAVEQSSWGRIKAFYR